MRIVAEDTVSYIIIVRSLNMIEKDNVLELHGISYYTVGTYESRASYKGAMPYFGLWTDDARSAQISGREYLCRLVNPDMLGYFRIRIGIQFRAESQN